MTNIENEDYRNELDDALLARDGYVASAGEARHVGDLALDEDDADVLGLALEGFIVATAQAEDPTDNHTAQVLLARLRLL